MKILMKRERLPIVRPFGEVIIELMGAPRAVQREIALKDGTMKKIEDYSIIVRPLMGKFESVIEKVVAKTADGDEVVKPKKYDALELGEKVLMKLTPRAYQVLYDAWEKKEIAEGTRLKIKTTKKGNKTYVDEILVIEDEEEIEKTNVKEEDQQAKKTTPQTTQTKPKLKG